MNLGGMGGLKRKPQEAPAPQVAPTAAKQSAPQAQPKYKLHEQFDEQAKGLALYFKQLAEFVIENSGMLPMEKLGCHWKLSSSMSATGN